MKVPSIIAVKFASVVSQIRPGQSKAVQDNWTAVCASDGTVDLLDPNGEKQARATPIKKGGK